DDVALAGHDEDWCRVVLSIEFLEDVETRLARNVHVQNYASGSAASGHCQKGTALGKTDDLISCPREHDGQSFPDGRIIVDDDDVFWRMLGRHVCVSTRTCLPRDVMIIANMARYIPNLPETVGSRAVLHPENPRIQRSASCET